MCGHKTEKVVLPGQCGGSKKSLFFLRFFNTFVEVLFFLGSLYVHYSLTKLKYSVFNQLQPIFIRPQILEPRIFKEESRPGIDEISKLFFCMVFINHSKGALKTGAH